LQALHPAMYAIQSMTVHAMMSTPQRTATRRIARMAKLSAERRFSQVNEGAFVIFDYSLP